MNDDFVWLKQTPDKPLFPDLLWSRPENRMHAGKLLIIGGSQAGFRAPADSYSLALKAGAGTIRLLLPDSLRKIVGESFLDIGEYAPSTPSGSFSYRAFADLLLHSNWADGVLLAGDFGRNSETSQLLEYYVNKHTGPLTITGDSLDHFLNNPRPILGREQTTIIATFQQLQKIAISINFGTAFTSSMTLANFAANLQNFTKEISANIIVPFENQVFVASEQKISSTPIFKSILQLAASASVWHLQNPSNQFEALSTSLT